MKVQTIITDKLQYILLPLLPLSSTQHENSSDTLLREGLCLLTPPSDLGIYFQCHKDILQQYKAHIRLVDLQILARNASVKRESRLITGEPAFSSVHHPSKRKATSHNVPHKICCTVYQIMRQVHDKESISIIALPYTKRIKGQSLGYYAARSVPKKPLGL